MKYLLICLTLCLGTNKVQAQLTPIGQWLDHFPYKDANLISADGNLIYCATKYAVFSYDMSSQELARLSKTNRLSDVGISAMNYDAGNQTLIVGYDNGNVDLLKGEATVNLPFIKLNNTLLGEKQINSIRFKGNLAYLSCGFGIVVVDIDREEIKETYVIGNNNTALSVLSTIEYNDSIFAATGDGLYKAYANEPFLLDFSNWYHQADLPSGIVNDTLSLVFEFNGKLHVKHQDVAGSSLYSKEASGWQAISSTAGKEINGIFVDNNQLYVCHKDSIEIYDGSYNAIGFRREPFDFKPKSCIISNGMVLSASHNRGLVWHTGPTSWNSVFPSGPENANAFDMDYQDGQVWVAAGNITGTAWNRSFTQPGVSSYVEDEWTPYGYSTVPGFSDDTLFDIISIAVDPRDPTHVFAGSHSQTGLLEFKNGAYIGSYDESNSSLQTRPEPSLSTTVAVPGLAFDDESNLWVVNMFVGDQMSVRSESGSWRSFDLNISQSALTTRIVVDNSGNKWILAPGTGIVAYSHGETISDETDDVSRLLTTTAGNGNLPSNNVSSIAVDLDGEIWVGTDAGPAIFYSPDDAVNGNTINAQQILIEQDGNLQILLETENITAIEVDGGNRKWLGTSNSGVFLMSEDGTKEILHFTAENSPLLSNEILSIEVNDKTGEVFFGTEQGLISYRGEATEGDQFFSNVLVYPNPVKETYFGPIAIKGLAINTDIKITDIAGRVVYYTKSVGGQATWDGNNFNGERAKTGVYLVFATDDQGEYGKVAKILFIN